jgi:membrane-bound inhibitor of C-type lysozyme
VIEKIKSTKFLPEVGGAVSGAATLNLHLFNGIFGGTMNSKQNKIVLVIASTIGPSLAFAGGGSDPATTDSYNCANGSKLTATYDAAYRRASIQLAGKTYRVTKAAAASGMEWWTKGNTGNLYAINSKYLRVETWTSALASCSIYAAHHEHFRQSKISTCVHLKPDVLNKALAKACVMK